MNRETIRRDIRTFRWIYCIAALLIVAFTYYRGMTPTTCITICAAVFVVAGYFSVIMLKAGYADDEKVKEELSKKIDKLNQS